MYLMLSIVVCTIVGFVLMMMGPLVGGILAFGIIGGGLFRGLFLLSDLHKRLKNIVPEPDRVEEAYGEYLKERDLNQ